MSFDSTGDIVPWDFLHKFSSQNSTHTKGKETNSISPTPVMCNWLQQSQTLQMKLYTQKGFTDMFWTHHPLNT